MAEADAFERGARRARPRARRTALSSALWLKARGFAPDEIEAALERLFETEVRSTTSGSPGATPRTSATSRGWGPERIREALAGPRRPIDDDRQAVLALRRPRRSARPRPRAPRSPRAAARRRRGPAARARLPGAPRLRARDRLSGRAKRLEPSLVVPQACPASDDGWKTAPLSPLCIHRRFLGAVVVGRCPGLPDPPRGTTMPEATDGRVMTRMTSYFRLLTTTERMTLQPEPNTGRLRT